MKRIYFLLFIAAGFLASCSEKQTDDLVAIGVVLAPGAKMSAQASHLNQLILQDNPASFQLDAGHIPHITLFQCFVKESDLSEIGSRLEGVFDLIKEKNLVAESLLYQKEADTSFAMIKIKKTEDLLRIHEDVVKRMERFIVSEGTEKAFVANPDGSPIDSFTLAYVPEYYRQKSLRNYDPHLSLGIAGTELLEKLALHVFSPMDFGVTYLGVYQLGDYGTAQKLIWRSEE